MTSIVPRISDIRIGMIGTGYVGLVSAACFANTHRVICVDKNVQKIAQLSRLEIPIYEPMLEESVSENVNAKRLVFGTDLRFAVENSTILFVAVGTPTRIEDGRADLQFIEAVATELAPLLTDYKVIVIKSTVPVGTGHYVKKLINKINPKAKFDIVSNPEFLREGSAVYDFMNPDRIIIGSDNDSARKIMDVVYAPFIARGVPVLHTDLESAELIKYAANCFLATKIAFVNEIATLCEKTGANIEKVTEGLGLDKRIGAGYLQPGPGFGGSCFPKDTLALVQIARDVKAPLDIVEAVVHSNDRRKLAMVDKIIEGCCGSVKGKKLAILGVAFKANTDDFRESAALTILKVLQEKGALLSAYDPGVLDKAKTELPGIHWKSDINSAIEGTDAVVIVTEWQSFANLDLIYVKSQLRNTVLAPTLIDLRNLYDPKAVVLAGLRYASIGRPLVEPITERYSHQKEMIDREVVGEQV